MSLADLPLNAGWSKFFKQKGNEKRKKLGALGRKKEQQEEQKYGYKIDYL